MFRLHRIYIRIFRVLIQNHLFWQH